MRKREPSKRLKAFGVPIELCVKFERLVGVKTGETPTFVQKIHVSDAMIAAMNAWVQNIELSAEDYELIAKEVKENESNHG